jgi:hypothetical protein
MGNQQSSQALEQVKPLLSRGDKQPVSSQISSVFDNAMVDFHHSERPRKVQG